MSKLKNSWLVQSFNARRDPVETQLTHGTTLYCTSEMYGGQTFTREAWCEVKRIIDFEYMGSADFEFGAVPKALSSIVLNYQNYKVQQISINERPVWIIAKRSLMNQVEIRVRELANGELRLGEYCDLREAVGLGFTQSYHTGWLEMENQFLVFTDKALCETTDRLLNRLHFWKSKRKSARYA